ncbi:MAG TPA: nitrile hydratase subunit alpha [Alphaproteobacteria bacterium]|jgi:nitrile hydratase
MPDTHDHDGHDHGHAHTPRSFQPDLEDQPQSDYQYLEIAVRELLIEKGLITPEGIRKAMEAMDARGPHLGAAMVARAWVDPEYKKRLLADGSAAARELGIDVGPMHLLVVENTPKVHNMIVCTLCSCYPRMILGIPPLWYKSREYRSRAVREPRAVLAEFGTVLPEGVEVRVHDSTADMRYLVLPMRPAGTEGMSEAELAALVTRDSMIGVALPESPRQAAAE